MRGLFCVIVLGLTASLAWAAPFIPGPATTRHAFDRDVPGAIQPVSWGWLGAIYYQVTPSKGYSPDEYTRRCIDDAWKWGANLVEFYAPTYPPRTPAFAYPFPWPEDDEAFPRPDTYHNVGDPRWTERAVKDVTRYAYDHGFLVQWFLHPKACEGGSFEENLRAWRYLARRYADVLTLPVCDLVDGFGWEWWWPDNEGRSTAQAWASNPGMYTYSTWTFPDDPTPSYSVSPACAHPGRPMGRDDQTGFTDRPLGGIPLGYQADCRPLPITDPTWIEWGIFSQGTWPDWIAKQARDFFRRNILAGDEVDAHSIWWLGEPEATLPAELRRYVYLASQDPIRHAVTCAYFTAGVGGYSDRTHAALKTPLVHRFDVPFDAVYIGNNFLRVERDPAQDVGNLRVDPGRTGEFDGNGAARTLSDDFLRTAVASPYVPSEEDVQPIALRKPWHAPRYIWGDYDLKEHRGPREAIWRIGTYDDSSAEFSPRTDWPERAAYTIGDPVESCPARMAPDRRGVAHLDLQFATSAKVVELVIGQVADGYIETCDVLVDGQLYYEWVRQGPYHANRSWLHVIGPFRLPEGEEHTLSFVWKGRGPGLGFDAIELVKAEPTEASGPFDPAPPTLEVDLADEPVLPTGISTSLVNPEELFIKTELRPGRYALRLNGLRAMLPTVLTLEVDGRFGPGFGLRPGDAMTAYDLPFTVTEAGEHRLRLYINYGDADITWDEVELIKLSDVVIEHTFVEPGGYLAHLSEVIDDPRYREVRDYHVMNDFPAVQVEVKRTLAEPGVSRSTLGLRCERVTLAGDELPVGATALPKLGAYLVLDVKGYEGQLGLRLSEYGEGTTIQRDADGTLSIVSPAAKKIDYRMRLGLIEGMYEADGLWKAMDTMPAPVQIATDPCVFFNRWDVPLVRIVGTFEPEDGPYLVCEPGADGTHRWIFRGAQPSKEFPYCDYLRVYIPPKSWVKVERSTWAENIARPAPGSQHILAMSDLAGDEYGAKATIRVLQVAPHVFSPSVQFKQRIHAARVNGEPWSYFEGDVLHLPVMPGDYKVEVDFHGRVAPHVLRTCALVRKAVFVEGELVIDAQLPPWAESMPGELPFAFAVHGVRKPVAPGDGYTIERIVDKKAIIHAPPGTVRVQFED